MVEIKFKKLDEKAEIPAQANEHDVGWDVTSVRDYLIKPFETKLISTGLSVEIPPGYEIQVRTRSGMALKNNMFVLNTPGTIDPGYRGDIGVILHNLKPFSQWLKAGERVAQLVIKKTEAVEWKEVDALTDSERGEGGFGSSD